jgi:hypothetical protein
MSAQLASTPSHSFIGHSLKPTKATHLARCFYEQTLSDRTAPLFWRQDGNRMEPVRRSEVAEWVSAYARGLQALNIARGARIALIGAPNEIRLKLLLGHALSGMTTIALADHLEQEEKCRLLDQSHVSLLIVESAKDALTYLRDGGTMPELQAIITLHGIINLPHQHMAQYTLDDIVQRGRNQPDRTSQWLNALRAEDAALLIGAQRVEDAENAHHRIMPVELNLKTHSELMQSCAGLLEVIQETGHIDLRSNQPVLVHGYFHHMVDFVACQILPLTLGCSVSYLNKYLADTEHFHLLQPQLLISDSSYIIDLQKRLERMLTQDADTIDRYFAGKLLQLGKKRYEQPQKMSWWENTLYTITFQSVRNRIRRNLGHALKGILSVDEGIPYSTQLFFETFGIRVIEVPSVFEKEFEKRRL